LPCALPVVEALVVQAPHRLDALFGCERRDGRGRRRPGTEAVEHEPEMTTPGIGRDVGGRVEDRAERPKEDDQVGKGEVGPQDPFATGSLEQLLAQLLDPVVGLVEQPRARRVAHHQLPEHVVAALELDHLLDELLESEQRVGAGERTLDDADDLFCLLLEDRVHERLATREVAVEGSGSDPGALEDRLDRGVDAALRKDRSRGGNERYSVPARVYTLSRPGSTNCGHNLHSSTNGNQFRFCYRGRRYAPVRFSRRCAAPSRG
jgi:hypothetical protein